MSMAWIKIFSLFSLAVFITACGNSSDPSSLYEANSQELSGLWILTQVEGSQASDKDPVVIKIVGEEDFHSLQNAEACEASLLALVSGDELHLIQQASKCFIDFPIESLRTEIHELLYRGVDYKLKEGEDGLFQRRLELDGGVYVFHPGSR